MYATCLFCNKSLGQNDTFETFPVGRRLAFDAAKGRLWVVCPRCERWNLTPLEERWETIEAAERWYRDTRTRASTDNIGLARLRDGTEIVRIGAPLRPEFAAWRYGDQFGRRRRRQLVIAGAGLTVIGAVAVGGMFAGGIGALWYGFGGAAQTAIRGRPGGIIAKIKSDDHGLIQVRRHHLEETFLRRSADGSLAVDLAFEVLEFGPRWRQLHASFQGAEARRVASLIVPKANRYGGKPDEVTEAVQQIDSSGGPSEYLMRLARAAPSYEPGIWTGELEAPRLHFNRRIGRTSGLFALPSVRRLALEMALHEDAEQRALEGELAVLERAWRDAEEIASISDSLLLPATVNESIDRLRSARPS